MSIVLKRLCLCLLLLWVNADAVCAQNSPPSAPDFDEVRNLVRAQLAGATDAEVNRASVEGLLDRLRGKVQLLTGAETNPPASDVPAISKTEVYEDNIALLRAGAISTSLPEEVRRQCRGLAATNKLIGLVLDLRFTGGDDYAAAARAVDLFVPTKRPLLDWGPGPFDSVEKPDALPWPVVVLVNGETTGAAEALAAMMREVGAGLILGRTTRGAAMTKQDFPLSNGQVLRIATSPVKLGDGTAIPPQGVKPDIEVTVTPETERAFLDDPYASPRSNAVAAASSSGALTNRPARRTRPNEADLVRARRDGFSLDGEFPLGRDLESEKPVLRDPALSRAVDLLKGLAVVRRTRP